MKKKSCKNGSLRQFRPGGEIIYQIFPDRWRRSTSPSTPEEESETGHRSFHGGDLNGIRESLPYLLDLGVTALYLNPIFSSTSPHRYDTTDFFEIDHRLGTRQDFDELSAALRREKILLVLDGVLNHTSHEHPWHLDPGSRPSHYIMKDGTSTMTWLDKGSLPKLDLQDKRIAGKMLDVLDAWPQADGWRLDAGHLLPQEFLKRIRKRIGSRYLLVEDWVLAPHYASKGLADGVTNFLFRENARTFFVEDSSPETFLDRTANMIRAYPRTFLNLSWNFLDNHDTERFVSVAGRDRLFRALLLLFTLPGLPMLFHGTEAGLAGKNPGEARKVMPWGNKKRDQELYDHVRTLAKIRLESSALRVGAFTPLFADNRSRTMVFERRFRDERVIVGLNDGYRPCRIKAGNLNRVLQAGESFLRIEKRREKPFELSFSSPVTPSA